MFIYYGIAAIVILVDQLTKWWIAVNMEIGERIPLIEPYLGLLSHRNRGAAWGMLEGQMWLFAIVTIVVVGGIVYYFQKEGKNEPLFAWSLMLLLGGAVGNFLDRMVRGEVVDFVSVLIPVINYDFPIFNVADASLTIGVVLVIIHLFLDEKRTRRIRWHNGTVPICN